MKLLSIISFAALASTSVTAFAATNSKLLIILQRSQTLFATPSPTLHQAIRQGVAGESKYWPALINATEQALFSRDVALIGCDVKYVGAITSQYPGYTEQKFEESCQYAEKPKPGVEPRDVIELLIKGTEGKVTATGKLSYWIESVTTKWAGTW